MRSDIVCVAIFATFFVPTLSSIFTCYANIKSLAFCYERKNTQVTSLPLQSFQNTFVSLKHPRHHLPTYYRDPSRFIMSGSIGHCNSPIMREETDNCGSNSYLAIHSILLRMIRFMLESNQLSDNLSTMQNVIHHLDQFLLQYPLSEKSQVSYTTEKVKDDNNIEKLLIEVTDKAIKVATSFCQMANNHKKTTWTTLQQAASKLMQSSKKEDASSTKVAAISISIVFSALTLLEESATNKAVASAFVASISRTSKPVKSKKKPNVPNTPDVKSTSSMNVWNYNIAKTIAMEMLYALLLEASTIPSTSHPSDNFVTPNLQIISYFAKAFNSNNQGFVDGKENELYSSLSKLSAKAIERTIQWTLTKTHDHDISNTINRNDQDETYEEEGDDLKQHQSKSKTIASLALACQIHPWPHLSPVTLIELAIEHDLWDTGQQICLLAHQDGLQKQKLLQNEALTTHKEVIGTEEATLLLIDQAMENALYRLADNIATNLYEVGGIHRFVEARLYHSYDTITKVIHRRQFPLIDRQVDRVDKAVARVTASYVKMQIENVIPSAKRRKEESNDENDASQNIRDFALQRLGEAGEIDTANRLTNLWGYEHGTYNEEDILKAIEERKKQYLQWDEVLPDRALPDLISKPSDLVEAFKHLRQKSNHNKTEIYGFDAEWEEDNNGVCILQIASSNGVILLLNIPALMETVEGIDALTETVGDIFDSEDVILVGFACKQDLRRLRNSSNQSKYKNKMRNNYDNEEMSWLLRTRSVLDVKSEIVEEHPELKTFGLSKSVNHFFGKPLDKSEQCSSWGSVPLSPRQRTYAALDAWVCVAIHNQLKNKDTLGTSVSTDEPI